MDNKDKEIEELKEKIYQLEQNLGQCENGYSLELHTARMIIRYLEEKVADYEKKLAKSVELPCMFGDKIYVIAYNAKTKQHYISIERTTKTMFEYEDNKLRSGWVHTFDKDDKLDNSYGISKLGIRWFTDRGQAENRLAELQQNSSK